MASITTRAGKGSALTNAEVDANFTNLNTDKLEAGALTPYLTSATAASTYAPLASPALTGTPTAPTAAVDTNTTQLATTAYVVGQGYLKSATASSTYAPLASPALTGTPTAPTAAANTNTTQVATTAFVLGQGNATAGTIAMNGTQAAGTSNLYARADHVHPTDTSRAPLASPTFTGTPAAPTAAVDTNTTQIATTAYVVGQGYLKSATAASTYQTQAGMSSYLTTATAASTYLALAGGTLTGNLAFSGTGRLIQGDFSNATLTSRTAIQTSTTNGATGVLILPNGTSTFASLYAVASATPTNASTIGITTATGATQLTSTRFGTGTYLPLQLLTSDTARVTIATDGLVGIGLTPAASQGVLQVFASGVTGGAPAVTGTTDANQIAEIGAGSVQLSFGAYANGDAWIQQRSTANFATNYAIGLNPNGGRVFVGGGFQETRVAVAASDIDLNSGNYFTRTISGATTLTVSNVPASGTTAAFVLELTNGGSATVNLWSGIKWAGGTAPTFTASGHDILGFYTHDGGTTWRGFLLAKDSK